MHHKQVFQLFIYYSLLFCDIKLKIIRGGLSVNILIKMFCITLDSFTQFYISYSLLPASWLKTLTKTFQIYLVLVSIILNFRKTWLQLIRATVIPAGNLHISVRHVLLCPSAKRYCVIIVVSVMCENYNFVMQYISNFVMQYISNSTHSLWFRHYC